MEDFAAVVDSYRRRAAYRAAGIAFVAATGLFALVVLPLAVLALAGVYAIVFARAKRWLVRRTRRLTRVAIDATGLYEGDAVLVRRDDIHQIVYRPGRKASLVRLRGVGIQMIVHPRDQRRFQALQPDTARYRALTVSAWLNLAAVAIAFLGIVAGIVMCDDQCRPNAIVTYASIAFLLPFNWPRRVAVSRTAVEWPRALWGRRRIPLADILEIATIRCGITFRTANRRSYRFMAFDGVSGPSFFHRIKAVAPVEVDALLN